MSLINLMKRVVFSSGIALALAVAGGPASADCGSDHSSMPGAPTADMPSGVQSPEGAIQDQDANAQQGSAFVANLEPFSPAANYMSLPGYYRFLTWQESGEWISRSEAEAAVEHQIATGEE